MGKNRLSLHIGTHKTGTTAIQNFLIEHAEELKKESIYFLGRYKSTINEISENSNYPPPTVHSLKIAIIKDISEIQKEREQSEPATFVISNEKLNGNKRTGYSNASKVASVLQEILSVRVLQVKVVVYLRRQDKFLESLYAQRIYNGRTYSFDEFLNRWDASSFSWKQLVSSYADLFGKDHIIVRQYHKTYLPELHSIIRDFGEVIGSEFMQQYEGTYTENLGYSRNALKLIHLLTPHLEQDGLKISKKLLRQSNLKSAYGNYSLLSPDDLETQQIFLDKINVEKIALNFSKLIIEQEREIRNLKKRMKTIEEEKPITSKVLLTLKNLIRG